MSVGSFLVVVVMALFPLTLIPLALHAQSDSSALRETIRQAISSDPRAAGLSETEISLLTEALLQQAQDQGVTAQDLLYRPGTTFGVSDTRGADMPGLLSTMTEALGFGDGDNTIPVVLWGSGMVLLFILGTMIEIRHIKHKRAAQIPPSAPKVGE
jgi:hypothetical protein